MCVCTISSIVGLDVDEAAELRAHAGLQLLPVAGDLLCLLVSLHVS